MDCIANKRRIGVCAYCGRELDPGQETFGLVVAIQSGTGFDTMAVKRFCSFSCKMRYRERIEKEIERSPIFGLEEFEAKMKEGGE
jgi:hypothetical protein